MYALTNREQNRESEHFTTCMIDEKLRMRGRRTQVSPGTVVLNTASWLPGSIDSLPPATPQSIVITVRPGQVKNHRTADHIVTFRSTYVACYF